MTECEEVAQAIFDTRKNEKLEAHQPLGSMADARIVARAYLEDESETIIDNVAQGLFDLFRASFAAKIIEG